MAFPASISDLDYQWALACRAFERCRVAEEEGSPGDYIDAHLDAFACVHALWPTYQQLNPKQRDAVDAADTDGSIAKLSNIVNGLKQPNLDPKRHAVANPGGGHGATVRPGGGGFSSERPGAGSSL